MANFATLHANSKTKIFHLTRRVAVLSRSVKRVYRAYLITPGQHSSFRRNVTVVASRCNTVRFEPQTSHFRDKRARQNFVLPLKYEYDIVVFQSDEGIFLCQQSSTQFTKTKGCNNKRTQIDKHLPQTTYNSADFNPSSP